MRISDWSSDVCSSDLYVAATYSGGDHGPGARVLPWPRRLDAPALGRGRCAGHECHCRGRCAVGSRGGLGAQTGRYRRSEERRVGKEGVVRVDLGGRRIIKNKLKTIIHKLTTMVTNRE